MVSVNKRTYFIAFLMLVFATLCITNAHAFLPSIFEPNEGDISISIMNQLFGDLVSKATSSSYYAQLTSSTHDMWLVSGLDPFQRMFLVYNYGCLTLAGMFAMYALVTGAIGNTNDGVFMGKDSPTSLFLIRTSIFTALAAPIFSGYNTSQVILTWFVINGIGMTDMTLKMHFGINEMGLGWFNSKEVKGNINDLYAMKMPAPQVGEIMYKTFEGYTCLYGLASEELSNNISYRSAQRQKELNATNHQLNQQAAKMEDLLRTNTSVVAMPNNVGIGAGTMTGYQSSGSVQAVNQESKARIAEAQNQQQQAFEQSVQNEIQANQEARNQEMSKDLDSVAATVYGAPLADFSQMKNDVWYFGISAPVTTSASAIKNPSNQNLNTACGSINFGESIVATSTTRAEDTLRKFGEGQQAQAMVGGDKAIQGNVRDYTKLANNIRNNRGAVVAEENEPNDREVVLTKYKELYGSYDQEIRQLAKAYVTEVNQNVRFREGDGKSLTGSMTDAEKENATIGVRRYYAEQLDKISRRFEVELLKSLVATYSEASDKHMQQYIAKAGSRAGSVSNLSQLPRNRGQYINYMKLAEMNVKTDGWFTFGMFDMAMTRNVGKIHQMLGITPKVEWASATPANYSGIFQPAKNRTDVPTTSNPVKAAANMLDYYSMFPQMAEMSSLNAIQQRVNGNTDIANATAALATGLDLQNIFDSTRHPMLVMVETGHNLISSMKQYSHWLSYRTAVKAENTRHYNAQHRNEKGFVDINDPSTQATSMMSYFAGTIMILGFMLAYYLPALPFLIWTGATVGWLVSYCEGVFMVGMWNIMHVFPHGDKYTGKGAAGYPIILSLTLRPIMIVFGFLAARTLVQVVGIYFNYTFATGMNLALDYRSANFIDETQMFGILAIYTIYTLFMMGLITKLYGLTTVFADNGTKWFGGVSANLGEYAAVGSAETAGKLQNIGGSAGNAWGAQIKADAETQAQTNLGIGTQQKLNSAEQAMASYQAPLGVSAGATTTATGVPLTNEIQRQRYTKHQADARALAQQAGIEYDEANALGGQLASKGYMDNRQVSAVENWGKYGVYARDPQRGAQNIREAAQMENSEQALAHMQKYVQSVTYSPSTGVDTTASGRYGYNDAVIHVSPSSVQSPTPIQPTPTNTTGNAE